MSCTAETLRRLATPQEIHAFIEEIGLNLGMECHTALVRCRLTPLADALRIFWYYDPVEGLLLDRSTAEAGLLLEIIKRVEIGYYPKAGVAWSHFENDNPSEDDIDALLDELQGIVPRCMFGTEFNP